MLTGPMGHGKSQIAAACLFEIALCADPKWWPTPREQIGRSARWSYGPAAALWVDPANYLNEQRQTFGSTGLTDVEIHDRAQVRAALESKKRGSAPGVLVVDDLGRSQRTEGTEWERDQIEMLLRARYDLRLPVIVTTNHSLRELGERYNVADILKEMCAVVGYTRTQGSRRAAVGLRRRAG